MITIQIYAKKMGLGLVLLVFFGKDTLGVKISVNADADLLYLALLGRYGQLLKLMNGAVNGKSLCDLRQNANKTAKHVLFCRLQQENLV